MTLDVITAVDLERFRSKLLEEIKAVICEKSISQKAWLKSPEVRKMLGISPGTLQNLRVNGTLPYSRIGSLIYYKYEDIAKLLEGNYTHKLLVHG